MPVIEFTGSSMQDGDNKQSNSGRLLNCYRSPTAGRSQFTLRSCLGTSDFVQIPGVNPRAAANVEGVLYVVQAGALWRVSNTRVVTNLGAIPDSAITTISGNNGMVTVVADADYYVWNGTSVTRIETGAFAAFNNVTFFNQLTVLTERGGRRVQWSEVANPLILDGLDFATCEARDDTNPVAIRMGGSLWMFKTRSIEKWYNTGTTLQILPGAVIDRGLKGFNLICEIPGGCFFLSNDDKAFFVVGDSMQPISNVAVSNSIANDTPERVFFYRDEMHEFCVIVFANRPSWIYDLTTQEWHERDEDGGPWQVKDAVFVYGGYYALRRDGSIKRMVRTGVDNGKQIRRRATSKALQIEGKRFRVPLLEVQASVGKWQISTDGNLSDDVLQVVGDDVLGAGIGALEVAEDEPRIVPQIMLETSKDFGMTFGQPKQRSLGDVGEYQTKIRWRSLGQFDNSATMRLSWTDPIDLTVEASGFVEIA